MSLCQRNLFGSVARSAVSLTGLPPSRRFLSELGMWLLPHGRKFAGDCSGPAMLEWRWNSGPDARWENWSTGLRVSGETTNLRCAHAPSRNGAEIVPGNVRTEFCGHHAADERAPGGD